VVVLAIAKITIAGILGLFKAVTLEGNSQK
jgi:hypothetical protein